jgi:diguanylate cyclase (GGDEF)-like protein
LGVQDGIGDPLWNPGSRRGSDLTDSKKTFWLRLKRHFAESFAGELLPQERAQDGRLVDEASDRRRRGAYRYVFLLLTAVLLPLAAYNIYLNQPLPILAALLLLLVLVVNIVLLSLDREAFLSPPVVVAISIALLIMSLYLGQSYNLYLMFPLLFALPVFLKTRDAIILGGCTVLMSAPAVLAVHDLATAAAIGLSMGLAWLVSAWLVFAMNEQSRRLQDLAITDSLTGAFNRRYMELQAGRCLLDWERHQRSVSLLLLDIDNFKKINDAFGHNVGDAALKSLVNIVKERIRGVDTLCRYGGEEFVLLLSETTAVQAKIVANQLRRAVEQAEEPPWGRMTISIGVCDVRHVPDLDAWLKRADEALYAAKNLGRNRVELAAALSPDDEHSHWQTNVSGG